MVYKCGGGKRARSQRLRTEDLGTRQTHALLSPFLLYIYVPRLQASLPFVGASTFMGAAVPTSSTVLQVEDVVLGVALYIGRIMHCFSIQNQRKQKKFIFSIKILLSPPISY